MIKAKIYCSLRVSKVQENRRRSNRCREYLQNQGVELIVTQEPSGTDIGRQIAGILFHRSHNHLCAEAEMFYSAPLRPNMSGTSFYPPSGRGHLCYAIAFPTPPTPYQGFGRGLDQKFIGAVNDYSAMQLKPDMTLLFDLPVETGLQKRATARNNRLAGPAATDRF